MTTYVENFGFAKTIIKNNKRKLNNEVNWVSNYDGDTANINLSIIENGKKDNFNMHLNRDDIIDLFGVQSVELPLEQRLINDFLNKSLVLDKVIKKKKTKKHYKKLNSNKNKNKTRSKI
jgi:hypothetical protein